MRADPRLQVGADIVRVLGWPQSAHVAQQRMRSDKAGL